MTDERKFDPRFQTEKLAFTKSELAACPKCARTNAPNRNTCIYCGATIGNSALGLADGREPEDWEPGYNVIVTGGEDISNHIVAAVHEFQIALPFKRLADVDAAEALVPELRTRGIETRIISDADLLANGSPIRLSKISFTDNVIELHDLNTAAVTSAAIEDVHLIVTGIIRETRSDTLEKRSRKDEAKVVEDSVLFDDEQLIDIYLRGGTRGFRVQKAGFDFRCLGEEMSILASFNITTLKTKLLAVAPNAKFVDCYAKVRDLIEPAWPTTSKRESQGLKRAGTSSLKLARTETKSNLDQFDRFSRLQSLFL